MTLQTPLPILPEMTELVTALADMRPYDVQGVLQLRQWARVMVHETMDQTDMRPPLTLHGQGTLDILKAKGGQHRRPSTTIAVETDPLVDDSWA